MNLADEGALSSAGFHPPTAKVPCHSHTASFLGIVGRRSCLKRSSNFGDSRVLVFRFVALWSFKQTRRVCRTRFKRL